MSDRAWKMTALALLAVFAVVSGVALGDRAPPVERQSGRIEPYDANPGQMVSVEWSAKITRVCPGMVTRNIVDSAGTVFILDNNAASYSHGHTITRTFTIPVAAARGPAKYRASVRYACNPLHYWWPITVHGPEVPFNIVAPMVGAPK